MSGTWHDDALEDNEYPNCRTSAGTSTSAQIDDHVTEFIYTWPDGREEVRYRRDKDSTEALELINQIEDLKMQHGAACPYSYRHV